MITAEAKEIVEKIYSDVIGLEITREKAERVRIAKLIAKHLKDATKDAVYQYVINQLSEQLES